MKQPKKPSPWPEDRRADEPKNPETEKNVPRNVGDEERGERDMKLGEGERKPSREERV
ncbi:MAG TPA: hypothetical protein VM889_12135 [Candidatus Thermoplasmatota archaeon]|nr:hypothetical protein [Candidatus Thermoplasmatota archaeon]